MSQSEQELQEAVRQLQEQANQYKARGNSGRAKAGTPISAGVETRDGQEFQVVTLAAVRRPGGKARFRHAKTPGKANAAGWNQLGTTSGAGDQDVHLWRAIHKPRVSHYGTSELGLGAVGKRGIQNAAAILRAFENRNQDPAAEARVQRYLNQVASREGLS